MRFAFLIGAFVSCVALTTVRAEARPSGDRVAEAKKAKKKTVEKPKAKSSAKKKTSKKVKVEKVEKVEPEDAAVVEEKPEPKPASKSAAPTVRPGGAAVAQAGDDEVPRNEPAKKKR